MAALRTPPPILILDFDETLVDVDSSEWVAQQLGVASLFDNLRWEQSMAWHRAMNTVLHSLHSQGVSIAHIRDAVCSLPIHRETACIIKAAHSLGCDLRIISDANTFFIETALAHHRLLTLFTQIHSNPAWIDAMGCLHYDDFHGHTLPPHNCPLCPPNMCKGSILEGIRAAVPKPASSQVIYAGDGSGDVCPSLRLSEQDYLLPRQGYPLSKLLAEHQVKARVRPWTTLATTLHDTLLECVASSKSNLQSTSDGVSSSATCSAAALADEVQKGSAIACTRHHCNSLLTVPKTSLCSQWRTPMATSHRCPPATLLHIHVELHKSTCALTRTFGLFKRTHASSMSWAGSCNAWHAFQNDKSHPYARSTGMC